MKAVLALFRLIEYLKAFRLIQLLTIFLRYLISSAFIYASVPKILGQRFTSLPLDNPVGFYFEAMYQTGFYWNFLGWSQMIAGLLMMTQRFAALGAFLFYPIIINVWLVTWSVGFKGTPVVTFLMFMGVSYLLLWEYRRWVPLLQHESGLQIPPSSFNDAYMRKPLWIWLGVFLSACILAIPLDPRHTAQYILLGFLGALAVFVFQLFRLRSPI